MRVCKIEGCGKKYEARGYCGTHYARFLKHGDPTIVLSNSKYKTVEERFLNSFEIVTESGCWIWTGALNNSGYGLVHWKNNKAIPMHRWSYERFVGVIPENMCICHSCDVRCCVNPNHLFLGTIEDNVADKVKKGRQARGEMHPRTKLTAEKVKEIYNSKVSWKNIMDSYNISKTTVCTIKSKKSWKHILGEI